MLSIKGRVFCPDVQSMEIVIVKLKSIIELVGSRFDISDIELWKLPATNFYGKYLPSTDVWTFIVYVDTLDFWNVIDSELEQLYSDGIVHSYVIEPHCPEGILAQN